MAKIYQNTIQYTMKEFLQYFKDNLLDKTKTTSEVLNHAFMLLYNRTRRGSSCPSCLISVYNDLLENYNRNYVEEIIVEEEVIVEEVVKGKSRSKTNGYDFDPKIIKI